MDFEGGSLNYLTQMNIYNVNKEMIGVAIVFLMIFFVFLSFPNQIVKNIQKGLKRKNAISK